MQFQTPNRRENLGEPINRHSEQYVAIQVNSWGRNKIALRMSIMIMMSTVMMRSVSIMFLLTTSVESSWWTRNEPASSPEIKTIFETHQTKLFHNAIKY